MANVNNNNPSSPPSQPPAPPSHPSVIGSFIHKISVTAQRIFRALGRLINYFNPFATKTKPLDHHRISRPTVSTSTVPLTPAKRKITQPARPAHQVESSPASQRQTLETIPQKLETNFQRYIEKIVARAFAADIAPLLQTIQTTVPPLLPKISDTLQGIYEPNDIQTIQQNLTKLFSTQADANYLTNVLRASLNDFVRVIISMYAQRLAELTTNLAFEETVDMIVRDIVFASIKTQIQAETEMQREKTNIQQARTFSIVYKSEIEELDEDIKTLKSVMHDEDADKKKLSDQKKLKGLEARRTVVQESLTKEQEFLVDVTTRGGAGGEANFLQQIYLDTFVNNPKINPAVTPACDVRVRELTLRYLEKIRLGQDPKPEMTTSIENFYLAVTEKFIPLLMAPVIVVETDSRFKSVDFFTYVWDQFSLPEEISALSDAATNLRMGSDKAGSSSQASALTPQMMLKTAMRGIVENQVKKITREVIHSCITDICSKIISPELLTNMISQEILPEVNTGLVSEMVQTIIRTPDIDFALQFSNYITAEDSEKGHVKTGLHRMIITQLENICKTEQSKRFLNIKGNALVTAEIDVTVESIREYRKGSPVTVETVKTFFAIKKEQAPNISIYGDLAFAMIFDVGGWTGQTLVNNIPRLNLKATISQAISTGTNDVRTSKDILAKQFITALEQLSAEFDNPPAPLPAAPDLKTEMDKTASLVYDLLLLEAINPKSWMAYPIRFTINTYLGKKEADISDLMMKIYTKTFSQEIVNFNLVMRTTDAFISALHKRANEVDREKLQAIAQ